MASRTVIPHNDDDGMVITGINKITIPRLILPTYGKPVDDKPTVVKPNHEKPVDVKPNYVKPVDVKPVDVKPSDDVDELIQQLSPTTRDNLGILLKSVSNGDAIIDTDSDGKAKIEYKAAKKLLWDGSNANIIAQPKSDVDIQMKVDACLELMKYMKEERPPSGVLLDPTKISVSKKKEYRLGHEFKKTEDVLGSGNMAGDILVFKDVKTGEEHAHKTMMISCFRTDEIKCWVDLNDTGCVPRLYLFKIEGNKVSVHMEILKNAKTLRSIIDEHMSVFYKTELSKSLVRPFSLYVLDGALEAISEMHSRGWVHKDLHPGNAMIQKNSNEKLAVKILDFGLASRFESPNGLDYRGFKSDISEVLRMFSALYTGGLEFNSAYDIQKNWRQEISNWFEMVGMGVDEKEELCCLVEAAMGLVHPGDVDEYRDLVKEKLNNAMAQWESEEEVLQKVVSLLFPEQFKDIHHLNSLECDSPDCVQDAVDSPGFHRPSKAGFFQTEANGFNDTASLVTDKLLKRIRMRLGICGVNSE